MYPAVPPNPDTDPTACLGNMSDTSVYRFELNPWWAASASPASRTDVHMPATVDASTLGTTHTAQMSRAVLRAKLTDAPRWIMALDSHPPAMLPTLASVYATTSGPRTWARSTPCRSFRN